LRGYFVLCKAEDAGGLTPTKDDNEAGRKIDRKDGAIFLEFDYKNGGLRAAVFMLTDTSQGALLAVCFLPRT